MNFNLLKYSRLFTFSFSILYIFCCTFSLSAQKQTTILHIGDSHLQPNNLSGMTRYQLQKVYGNAGRGLVFPYTLAKTNGPKDFQFSSSCTWTSSWITKPSTQAIGLTGISIKSNASAGSIKWATGSDTLSYPAQSGKVLFQIQDCASCSVAVNGVQKTYNGKVSLIDSIVFPITADTSKLEFKGGSFTLLDLMETSSQIGVLYHSTGVAGATFKSYNQNPNFEMGLQLLDPALVIVSLGTNESVQKWDSLAFANDVNLFINRIKKVCPDAQIILVLPNENYLKVNNAFVYNTRVDNVRAVLTLIAQQRNTEIYDQQEAMGGKGCMLEWQRQGLVNDDHIHFLRKGYQKQGKLLAEYLLHNYQF